MSNVNTVLEVEAVADGDSEAEVGETASPTSVPVGVTDNTVMVIVVGGRVWVMVRTSIS